VEDGATKIAQSSGEVALTFDYTRRWVSAQNMPAFGKGFAY
jgi:hypothetical protein